MENDIVAVRLRPYWNFDTGELRFAGCLVKQFRWDAPNQQAVLQAFQECNWPERIDDPLPAYSKIDPKQRLHDTIKSLNRHHVSELIRFHGDGTGRGVVWQMIDREVNTG